MDSGGAAVEVVELGPRFSHVTFDTRDLIADGWLPTGELDEVWAPSPALSDPPEPDTWLPSNVEIHDGPGGDVFARTDDVDWEVEPVGWVPAATLDRHDGWRRVRVDDGNDGPPVARALRDLWPAATPNPLGGWDVVVYTPWGEAVLWTEVSPGLAP